ncbi:MAG: AraC family transcriptional regulator [Clostridiales bacterium]|jgi:AraC-like DNA-binding protein|nr:AraC family transcriptional regulator [Clostridiales bacterium]
MHFLVEKKLPEMKMRKREDPTLCELYEKELEILEMVKRGDLDGLSNSALSFASRCHLPSSFIRSRKHDLTAVVTLLTHCAIEGGVAVSKAFELADLYIRAADTESEQPVIMDYLREAPMHFAQLVRRKLAEDAYPEPIMRALEYIENNLRSAVILTEAAEYSEVHPNYLSKLFKDNTGETFISFVNRRKLEEACEMLEKSSLSIAEISDYLAFGSLRYFIKVFNRKYGVTPQTYRDSCVKGEI